MPFFQPRTKGSGNLRGASPQEIEMKRVNEHWSDIDIAKETNLGLVSEILNKYAWVSPFLERSKFPLRTIGFRKMTPEQMTECVGCGKPFCLHKLYLLDEHGKEISVVGRHPNPRKEPNFWKTLFFWKHEPYIYLQETVAEAFAYLDTSESSRVMYVLERYTNVDYETAGGGFPHFEVHNEYQSAYIYKTPKGYKNFEAFVTDTLSKEFDQATKQLTAQLAEIDK